MTASTEQKKPLVFEYGTKVKYTGSTIELQGLEGKVTYSNERVTSIEVTEGNLDYRIGEIAYPDTKNLEPVPDPRTQPEMVEHPPHYGGKEDPYEVIKVAEAWGLDKDAYLFNVLKYIARAGKKQDTPTLQDLRKALFYLGRKITNLVKEKATK